jgi:hypothetical protein
MQRIFSALGQAFRQSSLILGMLSLMILSSVFIFIQQPSLAAPISTEGQKLIQQEQRSKESEAANLRQQAYEDQVKAAKDIDKVYEDNLKESKKDNSNGGIVEQAVEGAKQAVEKVTGK